MGGRETARGILFQTLICCIKMFEKDWIELDYDPDIIKNKSCDKVDILFTNKSKQTYALQVKSSINEFSVSKILKWTEELKSDVDADFYELNLIGNYNSKTKNYIENFNKENKNIKIICSDFDIEKIENKIELSIKQLLTNKNYIFTDKKISEKSKIIYFELLKTSISYKTITYDNILDILLESDNMDMRNFCELIRDRLNNRIDEILKFYKNTYALFNYETTENISVLENSKEKILYLDSDISNRINDALDIIKQDDKFINYLCREYLEQEKQSIEEFIRDLYIPEYYYHQKFNKTFHLNLREKINNIILKYNKIDVKISEKYNLQLLQRELFEDQESVVIKYKEVSQAKKELNDIIFTKEEEFARVVVFSKMNNDELHDKSLFTPNTVVLNSSTLSEHEIYDTIVWDNEAFTNNGRFAPQLYMRYIVFLGKVSQELKFKLEKFKNKSTIKFYFVEEE